MRRHELYAILEEGEGPNIEFKRHFSTPEKIAHELIAFANTKGGYLFFGVDDDGSIVGLQSEKSELDEIDHVAQFLCDPPVEIETEAVHAGGGKYLVLVRVPESTVKPHTLIEYDSSGRRAKEQGNIGYVRVGEHSIQASKEMMRMMRASSDEAPPLRLSIGHNERALFDYLDDHQRITVNQFADLVNISRRRASKILVSLVRAGTLLLHTLEKTEFFTLAE